jgi:hypothetical protein
MPIGLGWPYFGGAVEKKEIKQKTLDGWAVFQSGLMVIITLAATYVANQLTSLNQGVNELNKNMSVVITDVSNQKSVLTQHYNILNEYGERIRDLEIKAGPKTR